MQSFSGSCITFLVQYLFVVTITIQLEAYDRRASSIKVIFQVSTTLTYAHNFWEHLIRYIKPPIVPQYQLEKPLR